MAGMLSLTGETYRDKLIVFGAIKQEALRRGLEFSFRPINDRDHFSFEVTGKDDVVNGTIVASGSREGADMWLSISDSAYDFYTTEPNPRWRKVIAVVDSKDRHVLCIPFETVLPEMHRGEKLDGSKKYPRWEFNIIDSSSGFSYHMKKSRKNLREYVDDWKHIFPPNVS